MKGTYGLPPYAPIHVTKSFGSKGTIDEGTLRAYAREKLMGHREYEETCKWVGSASGVQSEDNRVYEGRLIKKHHVQSFC